MRWLLFIGLLVGCAEERELPTCTDCTLQGVHPAGYAMPSSDEFHGKDLERRGWNFALCQSCHGQDFKGRGTAPSCMSCHAKEPTSCDTCHGNPAATAAHPAHVAKGLACSECHLVPATWADHRKATTGEPLVTFGNGAKRGGANPSWDGAKCSGVYCHGGSLADPAAANTQPLWTGGAAQAACGTCHGAPPASHARSECATCHPNDKHIDGAVDLNGGGACAGGCHGDATTPAPATGAHRAHLAGGFFSQPIACSECHVVPAAVTDPGHIDSAGPAELTFGPVATARGTATSWSEATATCGVYCHGASAPVWTAPPNTTAYCGSCHGLPPTTPAHNAGMQLTDCATCHPDTVSAFGNILVGNGKHVNGVVDAR